MPSNQEAVIYACNCGCTGTSGPCECDGRCVPLVVDTVTSTDIPNPACTNHLPLNLTVDVSATSNHSDTCFNGSGTITFKTALTGGVSCWEGDISGSCTDCNGNSRTWVLRVVMCCPDGVTGALITLTPGIPGVIPVAESSATIIPSLCDPFMLSGCVTGVISGFVVACMMGGPFNLIYSNVCVDIYEVP